MDRRLLAIFLTLIAIVAVLAWPEVRKYRSDPARYEQLIGTGVDLKEAVLFAPTHEDYAYQTSPLVEYLRYERGFVDFDDQAVLDLADRVATEVGWKMLMRAHVNDIREAERLMWQWGEEGTNGPAGPGSLPNEQAREIMRWIAQQLILENLYYGPEALFSSSFEDDDGRRGDGHIDCDQIAHIFLHVAWRLDLDVREVLSPLHIYLAYVGPSDVAGAELVIEPTAFRGEPRSNASPGSTYEVGSNFFMAADELERYGHIRASSKLTAAAGYFQHATDRDIADGIVSEVMRGVAREGDLDSLDAPPPDQVAGRFLQSDRVLAELEAHLAGTRKPNLVTNLYLGHWRSFRWALALGDLDRAATHANRLTAIRQEYNDLVIRREPLERIANARLALASGRTAEAKLLLRQLYEEHGGAAATRHGSAQGDPHAEVLWGLALAGEGSSNRERAERFLLPVLAYEVDTHSDDARRRAVANQCERELRSVEPRTAARCASLAR
jgi:hypothetical protein